MRKGQLGTKLQRLRKDRGESIAQTAGRAGIFHSQLGRIENGKTKPHRISVEVALGLIKAFKPDIQLRDFVR